MKNKDKALLAISSKRKRKPDSVQYRFIEWLMTHDDEWFTIDQMRRMLLCDGSTMSSTLRNTKHQLGFIYKRVKIDSVKFRYKLVDCAFEFENKEVKPRKQIKSDAWRMFMKLELEIIEQ